MADASIVVTAGSGVNLHSDTRSYGGTTKHDQYVLLAEYDLATYSIIASSISIATANDHVLQIMAGSSLNVRIRRITIEQGTSATSAGLATFDFYRLTTAGTGGSTVTARPFDTADSAAGMTAMTLPSSKGTEGVNLWRTHMPMRQTVATAGTQIDETFEWKQSLNGKPIIIPAGTSNGIAVKTITATANATVTINVELVETSFV